MAPLPPDDTLDPMIPAGAPRCDDGHPQLELLFHPDLGRVGAWAPVPSADLPSGSVAVGRDSPLFVGPRPGELRPLADPCLSRRQFSVAWSPALGGFRVSGEDGARRPLRVLAPDGSSAPPGPGCLPEGHLLALGDRVLLRLGRRPPEEGNDMGLVGQSPAMVELRRQIACLADGDDTVLLRGETGTGKELAARALHLQGRRRSLPFVVVNASALPEALVESELFGHVRGAFSGATSDRDGLFLAAGGGTLFLDEIGEMPLGAQAKLLRALQERAVRPVGASAERPFAARVVVATHRDLAREVRAGRFRPDLFARLEAPQIKLPPLRERREDIPLLLARFLARRAAAGPLSQLFQAPSQTPPPLPLAWLLALFAHPFPRNVRELEKLVAAMAALQRAAGPFVPPPFPQADPGDPAEVEPTETPAPRQPPTRERLLERLEALRYNHNKVADELGVSHTTLHRWLRALGIARACDLPSALIRDAHEHCGGDIDRMATELRVSARGLRLRMRELHLAGAPPS